MAEHSTSLRWFFISLAGLALLVVAFVAVERHRAAAPGTANPRMTAVEKSYLSEIEVAHVKMSAASNFLGDTVYYLDGQLTNKGSQTVRQLTLRLNFMDPFGQVVLRQTEHPVTGLLPPLKPGETLPLHLTFEHLPAEWNEGPPVIKPVYASFR